MTLTIQFNFLAENTKKINIYGPYFLFVYASFYNSSDIHKDSSNIYLAYFGNSCPCLNTFENWRISYKENFSLGYISEKKLYLNLSYDIFKAIT